MKAVIGLVSLLLALAIVGVLVKKQMRGVSGPANTTPQQSQQVQQQFKQSLDDAMQQTRPMPDDK